MSEPQGVMAAGAGQGVAGAPPTLTEALTANRDLAGRALRSAQTRLPPELFAEVAEWVGHLRVVRNLAVATCHQYARGMEHFLLNVAVEGEPLQTRDDLRVVRREHIEGWLREQYLGQSASVRYRAQRLYSVRSFFAWRAGTGRQAGDPAAAVRGPKVGHRAPRKYTTQQLRALFASCDRSTPLGVRDFAVLAFLYGTGARRGEMERLSLDDLEIGPRVGRVRFLGKGAKERIVPFEGPVIDAMSAWLAVRERVELEDPSAVWVSVSRQVARRLQMRGLEQVLERASERAGLTAQLGCGLHRLRVTFATDLYDSGVDLERIRILLGHETIETTRRYLAVSDKQLTTRLPAKRAREVMHGQATLPLWYRQKLGEGGTDGTPA